MARASHPPSLERGHAASCQKALKTSAGSQVTISDREEVVQGQHLLLRGFDRNLTTMIHLTPYTFIIRALTSDGLLEKLRKSVPFPQQF